MVEQQIGRVDRLGSHWEQLLAESERRPAESRGEVPRIEVLPVIFKGTYTTSTIGRCCAAAGTMLGAAAWRRYPALDTMVTTQTLQRLARAINEGAPDFSPREGELGRPR